MSALWTYCVLAPDDAVYLPRIEGVEPGTEVELVAADGDLVALVSRVPLSDYADGPLRAHLNDIAWVERVARAHQHVLDQAMAVGAIVPLRLCTIFRGRHGVTQLLRSERAEFRAGLRLLQGRAEWGLKLFVNVPALERSIAGDDEAGPSIPDGLAFFARKQRERRARQTVDDLVEHYASEAHERLLKLADASKLNRVQHRAAHGRDAEMVLNSVYLVSREHDADLPKAVEALRASWPDAGLELELTGPWPGYNFVADTEVVAP